MKLSTAILAALATLAVLLSGMSAAIAAVFYPTSFTLVNGLQVVVVPNHLAPAVTQMVWYKVGSTDEVPGKTGLAHYLEHLMFRGTSNLGPGEFSKIIAAQGGSENAFTSSDYTAYFETVAADRLPMVMELEADRMRNLRIMPQTAVPELSVVLNERQQRTDNDPQGRFEEKAHYLLMPHYPYGVPVIGWRKEIERLTAADATKFYHDHYAPNNAVVIISGDVQPEDVMRLAATIYGAVPAHLVLPRKPFPKLGMPSQHNYTVQDVGVQQEQVQLTFVVPSYNTQNGNEAYALEVLSELLDSGEIGVLYRDLVEEQGVASAIDTGFDPDARGDTTFTIAATPKPGVAADKLSKALATELHLVATHGVNEQEVAAAKERLKRMAVFARDSLMTPGYAFGMGLATGHTVADVEEWPDRIDAVTTADVDQALRHLVANPHYLAAALLPDHNATPAQVEAAQPVTGTGMGIR